MKMNDSGTVLEDQSPTRPDSDSPSRSKQILIPLDLMRSTAAPLLFAQRFTAQTPACLTLLHVVNVPLPPGQRRIFDELCAEAQFALTKLAWLFFGHRDLVHVRVRVGRPKDEILAEAKERKSDLIILSGRRPSWNRFFAKGVAARVAEAAPCATLVLPDGKNAAEVSEAAAQIPGFDSTPSRRDHLEGSARANRFGAELWQSDNAANFRA
jgi:nucleotide-binding universal stress UspA family protein